MGLLDHPQEHLRQKAEAERRARVVKWAIAVFLVGGLLIAGHAVYPAIHDLFK